MSSRQIDPGSANILQNGSLVGVAWCQLVGQGPNRNEFWAMFSSYAAPNAAGESLHVAWVDHQTLRVGGINSEADFKQMLHNRYPNEVNSLTYIRALNVSYQTGVP
jgi:hypothetical protein